jgi:hypothetical protein
LRAVNPKLLAQLERIASSSIQILPVPEIASHFVLERNGCAVLVERRENGFGAIGSPGSLSDKGFSALVQRDGRDWFIGKNELRAATESEAAEARRLYRDLREILV